MNKIGEALKGHDLRKELGSDKEFMEEVKKLFEEHGLECDSSQIEEIIDKICSELESSEKLSEDELNDIAGGTQTIEINAGGINYEAPIDGISNSKKRSAVVKFADIVVRATSTIIGCAVGGLAGAALSSEIKFQDRKVKNVTVKAFPTVVGVGTGSVVGYKLGRTISNKLGLS